MNDIALHFNPLNDETELRNVRTDWKRVDEFWIATEHGPIIAGELWKDTQKNRELIVRIQNIKTERKAYLNKVGAELHKLFNQREQ